MKTKNGKLYLTIFNEYMDGKGLDFARHGLNRLEIIDMVSYYQRILKPDILNTVVIDILYSVLEIDMEA